MRRLTAGNRAIVTLVSVWFVAGLIAAAPAAASAQGSGLLLAGTVADAAGEVMEGVIVSVKCAG